MRTEISFDDWLLVLVEERLRTLITFSQDLERMAQAELSHFSDSIEESVRQIQDERERSDFFEWHHDTLIKYEEEYPQLVRELVLVKANFILEAELVELARWLEREKSIPSLAAFKKGRPSNSQIGLAADYLEAYGVALARGITWDDIDAIRLMRNAIVHSDGNMAPKDFQAVANSRLSGIAKLKNGHLRLHSPLHDVVVRPIREFFESIDRSLYP